MQPEVVDVIATAATVVAAVVAAVSAYAAMVSARSSTKQVGLMIEELEKRERPYIYGHFQARYRAVVQFSLENKGNAAGIDVRACFEEPAPTRFNDTSLNSAALFSNTIAFFPPGESYTVDLNLGQDLFAEGKPTGFTLNLSYQTLSGREIQESIVYDISYLRSVYNELPTAADVLKEIKEPLEKIARTWSGGAMKG